MFLFISTFSEVPGSLSTTNSRPPSLYHALCCCKGERRFRSQQEVEDHFFEPDAALHPAPCSPGLRTVAPRWKTQRAASCGDKEQEAVSCLPPCTAPRVSHGHGSPSPFTSKEKSCGDSASQGLAATQRSSEGQTLPCRPPPLPLPSLSSKTDLGLF